MGIVIYSFQVSADSYIEDLDGSWTGRSSMKNCIVISTIRSARRTHCRGKPMFPSLRDRIRLRLGESRTFSNGVVLLRYSGVR
jgi:hypothetical protein